MSYLRIPHYGVTHDRIKEWDGLKINRRLTNAYAANLNVSKAKIVYLNRGAEIPQL